MTYLLQRDGEGTTYPGPLLVNIDRPYPHRE